MLRFQRSSDVSSIGAEDAIPALETRMSIPPNSIDARAKLSATASSLVTSITTERTRSPECRFESTSAVSDKASSSMSARTTQAPSRRNRSAVAEPIPPAPPVTSAIFPARLFGLGIR